MTPQEIYVTQLQKTLIAEVKRRDTVKGSIQYQADRCRWMVRWWDEKASKICQITRYNGEFFPCTAFVVNDGVPALDPKGRLIPDKTKCQGYKRAEKLLIAIGQRKDQANRGECKFNIEEFTKSSFAAVPEAYDLWINEAIRPSRKPATIKGYLSYGRTWVRPYFTKHPVPLHEVDLETLMSFMKHIHSKLKKKNKTGNVGKTTMNIMSALHSAMDYAYRCGKIQKIPPFPKFEDYELKKSPIEWLDRNDLDNVFEKLPESARPIFDWLKYHFRRPGEACALYKTDYDVIRQSFTIQRAISARQIVDSVKTNWKNPTVHVIPCKSVFVPTAERLINENTDSPFMFVNPRARKDGGRYTLESLRVIWYHACDDAEVKRIWPYKGLKHTACTHFIENGGTEIELQKVTGHKNMKSVNQYADITLARVRKVQADAEAREEFAERKRKEMKKNEANPKVINLFGRDPK
ncbi:MAG: tyrosine-type recombinase/integrase [Desulfobacterales bacterium]|nr:tyrosine-type recombinase/integrase [Desulfobacterales bacterium]